MLSSFVHRVPLRPTLAHPGPARSLDLPQTSTFVQRVDRRPARWMIAARPGWDDPKSLVGRHLRGAPVRRAFYVGRVDQAEGDVFTAVVWESPSGRASVVTLRAGDVRRGPQPQEGDRIHLWTWEEVDPETGTVEDRHVAQVFHKRRIGAKQRKAILALLSGIGE